jgi:beta-lactamase superfamily II metal-dependent hydrolase
MTATLTVLDVGHGNAAVLCGPEGVVVIDAGPGGGDLLRYLREEGISEIDCVVISHVDADHLRGLLAVLEEPTVSVAEVRLNSDPAKQSELWDDLAWTMAHLDQSGELDFQISCVAGDVLPAVAPEVSSEVLAPTKELAAHGPGWRDGEGRVATTNSCSVVVRVGLNEAKGAAILAADIDEMGFSYMSEFHEELEASLLVFPHHGGNVAATCDSERNAAFARNVIDAVTPETVVFSVGRGRHGNPRPEVVAAVREKVADVRIACTQLSETCRPDPPPGEEVPHLLPLHANGRERGSCCAGTLRWELPGEVGPDLADHDAFKAAEAPSALCR